MSPERWETIERLYHDALDRDPVAREAFLGEACAGDDALRSEVASLLAHDEMTADFIESPALVVAARELASGFDPSGQTPASSRFSAPPSLGSYKILSPLGRGGMGEVYLALDSKLGRKVAVKLLPAQFTADESRVRRFTQEARTVSALNHPNILTIYEIGDAPADVGGAHFIVTEYVEGETLRWLMDRAPKDDAGPGIELSSSVEIALQIASALSAAHLTGITHRDIKPENVMVRRDGLVKVLDFGLAKLSERRREGETERRRDGERPSLPHSLSPSLRPSIPPSVAPSITEAGIVLGTPRYMSPEQAGGEKVDARTDIFSLGVVFYEMIAGRPPFEGATPSKIIAAILRDDPPPLPPLKALAAPEIELILDKALCKDRENRYQTVDAMSSDLKLLKKHLEQQDKPDDGERRAPQSTSLSDSNGSSNKRNRTGGSGETTPAETTAKYGRGGFPQSRLLFVAAAALVLAAAGWFYWRSATLTQARAAVPKIEELANAERYFEAYDLAIETQKRLPNDPTIARLMRTIADDLSVVSDPPGAEVYLKRFAPDASGNSPAKQLIGLTPITHHQIARGSYLLYIEKQGYATLERSLTGLLLQLSGVGMPSAPITMDVKLMEASKVPARMTVVPGGEVRLGSWGRPTDERVRLDDYIIDKYEVANREYKDFINAGGYLNREFWRRPIIKNGRELPWEEAILEFKDRTGLPGPRSWASQDFPEGKAEHPVTDISWYEAAAYAAFKGKELPTIFQWEKAARGDLGGPGRGRAGYYIMPWGPFTGSFDARANFNGRGTMPVESLEFGLSPYGCYNTAGNVAEWCSNQSSEGFMTAGGSWAELPYIFGAYGAYPGGYSSSKLGFRCVMNSAGATGDQGGMPLLVKPELPVYTPVSDAKFQAWQNLYRYAKPPLNPEIVQTVETADWRREKVTFTGAEGERAIAFLYLPKLYPPPYQVIQFLPGDDVFNGMQTMPVRIEGSLAPFIKSGRAVLAVVLKGFQEREWPPTYTPPPYETVEYRDLVLNWTADERRGLDYVETRPDLDAGRIAFYGVSGGESRKIVLPAVETRYRSLILVGCGLNPIYTRDVLPEINPVNLIPQIRGPKLLLNGRYDEVYPLKSYVESLLKLLREPKRMIVFDGGHTPSPELYISPVNAWLDETLGPVRRK